jgi:DNA-binding NtrC family response regulator
MERGRFRSDLYFRLNVFAIALPPLRERLEDVPLLLQRGLAPTAARLCVAPPVPGPGFVERLERHTWPGNVRELHNLVERLCIEYPGEALEPTHLAGLLETATGGGCDEEGPEDLEAMQVVANGWRDTAKPSVESLAEVLRATGGNVSRASRRIGVARSTLRYWIRRNQLKHLIPGD